MLSTTQNARRADCFHLLSECERKMGNIRKAEALKEYANSLGYEQGGKNAN